MTFLPIGHQVFSALFHTINTVHINTVHLIPLDAKRYTRFVHCPKLKVW